MNEETKNAVTETVMAVLPSDDNTVIEKTLTQSVTTIELQAEAIIIETDEDYQTAAVFGRDLKQKSSEVMSFFKPMKESAHAAHRAVCEREKTMLSPLNRAEITLKRTMGTYALKKQKEQREAEDKARRLAQEEADRKLADAVQKEASGNNEAAASAMLDAQAADTMSRNVTVAVAPPMAAGVSQTKDWELVSIDPTLVPIVTSGTTLRPVDEKAVLRLIRAEKGTVVIPGVIYKETIATRIWR